MYDLLNKEYVGRLQALRERVAQSIRRLEMFRENLAGPVLLPELESHRPYSPGDNPVYIDWNLYARTDRFFTKSMMREDEGILHLILDTSRSMANPFPRKSECSFEVAGAMAYLSMCAGNHVRLYSMADRLMAHPTTFFGETGTSGMLGSLSRLTDLPAGNGTDLPESLRQALSISENTDSWILLISDLIDLKTYGHFLEHLSHRSTRFETLQVLHPEELNPTIKGNLLLTDPERDKQARRTIGYRSSKEIRKAVRYFHEETKRIFIERGVGFTRSSCNSPFESIVLRLLLNQGGHQ